MIQAKKRHSHLRDLALPSQPVSGSLVSASKKRGWSDGPSPAPPSPALPPCGRGKWGHRWSFSSSGSSRLLHAGAGSPEDGGASAPFALRAATCALTCVLVPAAAAAPEPGAQCDSGHGHAPRHQQREEESWGKVGDLTGGGARGAGAGRRSDVGTGLTWGAQDLVAVGWGLTCREETYITRCSPWSPASCALQSQIPRPMWDLGVPGPAMLCVPGRCLL